MFKSAERVWGSGSGRVLVWSSGCLGEGLGFKVKYPRSMVELRGFCVQSEGVR